MMFWTVLIDVSSLNMIDVFLSSVENIYIFIIIFYFFTKLTIAHFKITN